MDDEKDRIIVEVGGRKSEEDLEVAFQLPILIWNSKARNDWNLKVLGDVCNKKVDASMCGRHQRCATLTRCSNLSTHISRITLQGGRETSLTCETEIK